MADTRVVVVLGARQVGKSTLLQQVAAAEGAGRTLLTLDDQVLRTAASRDPAGFIATLDTPVAIDEIQRVPELLTEIKLRVDRDQTPGQFAITGSANLLKMKRVKESLAGRAEYIRLRPFSQGELRGMRESFIPGLFESRFPIVDDAPIGHREYAEMLAVGGYPEIQGRPRNRRFPFFESYIEGILERDIADLRDVTDSAAIAQLLRAVGATSAAELNIEGLSRTLDMGATTIRRNVELLEMLFLIHRLPAWRDNLLARSIKRPKVHIADTGLLAFLTGTDERRVANAPDLIGMFFETFAAMELVRQISWLEDAPRIYHYRDREQREVDLVLEFPDGSVAGVEVKAAATVRDRDFRGLRYLRDKLGDKFKAGALLYTGARSVPFGDRLAAVPFAGLWEGGR